MEKQTKIVLGLAAAGVVAYLVLKPKKAVTSTNVQPYNDFPHLAYQFEKGSPEEIAFQNQFLDILKHYWMCEMKCQFHLFSSFQLLLGLPHAFQLRHYKPQLCLLQIVVNTREQFDFGRNYQCTELIFSFSCLGI